MNVIRLNSRGNDVVTLQRILNLHIDGIFGRITEEAVKTFQTEHNLIADGVVGARTWSLLLAQGQTHNKRTIDKIIVHCTATPEGREMTVEQIRQEHIKNRGFADIGYHWVVYLDGSIHAGRSEEKVGAHCTGQNAHSIGVCYVGGVENKPNTPYNKLKAKDTRTVAQKKALVDLLKQLKARYPQAKIYGHKDFARKSCPCFDAKKEYKNL